MAVVEDALAGTLRQDPHVVERIQQLLPQQEALGRESRVARGTRRREVGRGDLAVGQERGELRGKIRDLGGQVVERLVLGHDGRSTMEQYNRQTVAGRSDKERVNGTGEDEREESRRGNGR